jgi:hypothetical protein
MKIGGRGLFQGVIPASAFYGLRKLTEEPCC